MPPHSLTLGRNPHDLEWVDRILDKLALVAPGTRLASAWLQRLQAGTVGVSPATPIRSIVWTLSQGCPAGGLFPVHQESLGFELEPEVLLPRFRSSGPGGARRGTAPSRGDGAVL